MPQPLSPPGRGQSESASGGKSPRNDIIHGVGVGLGVLVGLGVSVGGAAVGVDKGEAGAGAIEVGSVWRVGDGVDEGVGLTVAGGVALAVASAAMGVPVGIEVETTTVTGGLVDARPTHSTSARPIRQIRTRPAPAAMAI
jgi:hypothetical protein